MIRIEIADPLDAAAVVDALITAAELEHGRDDQALAARYTRLADVIGDGLDALPGTQASDRAW